MTGLTLATVVCTAILAAGGDKYADAHRTTVDTGKPLVVMVGTDWCGPCQTMKKRILPKLRKRKIFKKIAFAEVNPDRNGKLAQKLIGSGPIPQLVMYRKTSEGWKRRKLVGGQSVELVEKFISEGLSLDKAGKTKPQVPRNPTTPQRAKQVQAQPVSHH